MRNSILSLLFIAAGPVVFGQLISITTTTTTGTGNTGIRNPTTNGLTFSGSAGSTGTNINTNTNSNYNGNYNNGYNNTYGNNGYNNGYNNNGYNNGYNNTGYNNGTNNGYNANNNSNYNNGNSYNYNNAYNTQNGYTANTDGYGSTVEIEDGDGKRTTVETTTDSTQAEANKSIKDKINSHIVHFTGLVMSDNYNEGNLSKAYVMDKYSEFLKPGKYGNISASLPNSVAYTFDGIAVPPKTRLIIYSGTNFSGAKLVDVTGPAIINNSKWEFDERYTGANKKTYSPDLQTTFPQAVRQWSRGNMHDWQNGSIEILEVPE
jgi:hypothetical protein